MQRLVWIGVFGGVIGWGGVADAGGGPMFQEVANVFGTQPCGGGGCYTRYLRVGDLDGDGDLDILFPNDSGAPQPLVVYENDGAGNFSDVSAAAVGGFSGRLRQIGLGDVDGDGDLDIYGPNGGSGDGALFINDGDGNFENEGDARLPAQAFAVGSTRMGDVDDDGDLDIVIANSGNSGSGVVYVNDGTGNFTELANAIPFNIGGDINDVDLLDVDRDFDLDLMTNAHSGANRIWLNDGTGVFASTAFSSSGGLHYGPGVCDVDGDTDIDIWIDNQGPSYTERLWINDGDGNYSDQTVAQVSGNPGSDDNGIVCADVDNDGDFDAVVVALGTPERLLVNDGAGNFTYLAGAFSGPTDSSLWAEMGDLDGDHRIDIVTGQGESGSFLNRVFLGTNLVPPDTLAPRIVIAQAPPRGSLEDGEVAVTHYAINDNAMSDMGPRLSAAYAEVDPGGADLVVPASFMGGDVFRVELPSAGLQGTITYRLCAEDRHGNAACGEDLEYDVDAAGGTDGGTDTGDSGEPGTDGDVGTDGTSGVDPDDTGGPDPDSSGSASVDAGNDGTGSTGSDTESAGGSEGSTEGLHLHDRALGRDLVATGPAAVGASSSSPRSLSAAQGQSGMQHSSSSMMQSMHISQPGMLPSHSSPGS